VGELPPRNKDCDVDDLSSLMHLNPCAVLAATQQRFDADKIYTFAGPILLAMNPYKAVSDPKTKKPLYNMEMMERYMARIPQKVLEGMPAARREKAMLPPHLFCHADDAYKSLQDDNTNQAIIISGESGAGKTETAKYIMQYLTCVSSAGRKGKKEARDPAARRGSLGSSANPFEGASEDIEKEILSANPIMEAFGNAKTVRNDNSSRFGKFMKIYFDDKGIAGGSITNYLLEKTRVTHQSEGERNYHSFYQLLLGSNAEEKELYQLGSIKTYRYVKNSADVKVMGHDDADEFRHFKAALTTLMVNDDTQQQLFSLLAAVLHLGNIRFTGGEKAAVGNVDKVALLLGLEPKTLSTNLIVKTVSVQGKVTEIPLKQAEARDVLDALSKTLYGNLFQWLMVRINMSLRKTGGDRLQSAIEEQSKRSHGKENEAKFIGVLDIFGFEVFEKNSFEQLCINFANEKLQQFFTQHVFKKEVELYVAEGIDFSDINFTDNQPVIDLIEKKPVGVLLLLDEQCLFPRSSDATFLQKLESAHRKTASFAKPHAKAQNSFVVKHFASNVTYDVTGFLEKNKDRLPDNVETAIKSSSNSLVQELFSPILFGGGEDEDDKGSGARRGSSRGMAGANAFLGSKFKVDMNNLMSTLNKCSPHFIRCIKPNSMKEKNFFMPELVSHQMQYLGVLNSIEIRTAGFCWRMAYEEFYKRFAICVPAGEGPAEPTEAEEATADWQSLSLQIIENIWAQEKIASKFGADRNYQLQMGKTRVFMRKPLSQALERLREFALQDMDKAAVLLQSVWRMHIGVLGWAAFKVGVTRFQAAVRARKDKQGFDHHRSAITTLQNRAHTWLLTRWFDEIRSSARLIASFLRKNNHRLRWLRLRRGLKMVHSLARGFIVRKHVLKMLDAVLVIQDNARDFISKNRVYWNKVHLALRLQSWCRGFRTRDDIEETMVHLDRKRAVRHRHRAVRRVQSKWRSLMVNRRFRQVTKAAMTLQRWTNARSARTDFVIARWAARRLQSGVRGMAARIRVAEMLGQNMVSDEQWRLKIIREREQTQIRHMNGEQASRTKTVRNTAPFVTRLVDVDMIVDASDVYATGWATLVAELETRLAKKRKVIHSLCVGATHSLVVTDGGELYSWGWGDHGQLGHGTHANETMPRLVEHLLLPSWGNASGLKVREVCAGQDHTVMLTETGKVFSWGANRRGQLGHSSFKDSATPRPIDCFHRKVAAIAAGAHHSAALMEGGLVFSWGSGLQLGRGVFTGRGDSNDPMVVKAISKYRIKTVRCGWKFTIVLSHSGDLFAWGENNQGQLGLGDTNDRVTPVQVRPLRVPVKHGRPDKVVKTNQLWCGGRHVVVLSAIYRVFCWGWNKHGQLGLGDTVDRHEPHLVLGKLHNCRITQGAAGWRHTFVLTETYQCFAWGQAGCLQKLNKQVYASEDESVDSSQFISHQPQEVTLPSFSNRTPATLSCAWSHSLTVSNVVFNSSTRNVFGQTTNSDLSKTATKGSRSSRVGAGDDSGRMSPEMVDDTGLGGLASPQQLQEMSADELRVLVAQLQQGGSSGVGDGGGMYEDEPERGIGGRVRSESAVRRRQLAQTQRDLGKTQAERMREAVSSTTKRPDRDIGGGWNDRVGRAGVDSTLERTRKKSTVHARAKNELQGFETDSVNVNKRMAAEQKANLLERTQRETFMKAQRMKAKQQLAAEKELDAVQRAKEQERRNREGGAGDMDISSLFSPAHLVASSAKLTRNEEVSPQHVERMYRQQRMAQSRRTEGAMGGASEREKLSKLEHHRRKQAEQAEHAAGPSVQISKPNRRASATMRVRQQIQREILGGEPHPEEDAHLEQSLMPSTHRQLNERELMQQQRREERASSQGAGGEYDGQEYAGEYSYEDGGYDDGYARGEGDDDEGDFDPSTSFELPSQQVEEQRRQRQESTVEEPVKKGRPQRMSRVGSGRTPRQSIVTNSGEDDLTHQVEQDLDGFEMPDGEDFMDGEDADDYGRAPANSVSLRDVRGSVSQYSEGRGDYDDQGSIDDEVAALRQQLHSSREAEF
jgi:myosin heavy subunit/alpha-tubulin suppressor-like RCC1 family protein